jgi:1-acyl-sn-glycerol-3-phosphate acyltransferase
VRPRARFVSLLRIFFATLSSYLLGYFFTVALLLLAVGASLLGLRGVMRGLIVFWCHLLFIFNGRLIRIHGRENKARDKPYLLLANHSSMFDIPVILAVAPEASFMGREKLMRIPVLKSFLKAIRYIPIDTEMIRKAHMAIDEAVRKAGEGASIAMFPEGTRSSTGRVQRLKRGFVYVLRASGLDVLPIAIRGTFAMKPKKGFFIDPRDKIEAFMLPPIENSRLVVLSDQEIMEKVRSVLDIGSGGADERH